MVFNYAPGGLCTTTPQGIQNTAHMNSQTWKSNQKGKNLRSIILHTNLERERERDITWFVGEPKNQTKHSLISPSLSLSLQQTHTQPLPKKKKTIPSGWNGKTTYSLLLPFPSLWLTNSVSSLSLSNSVLRLDLTVNFVLNCILFWLKWWLLLFSLNKPFCSTQTKTNHFI